MGGTNFPSGLSVYGVPILPAHIGKSEDAQVFFVDGNATYGNSGNDGLTPGSALANINQAYTKCVDGRGDVIFVAPGTYTLAATLTLSKSNVKFLPLFYSLGYPSVIITS